MGNIRPSTFPWIWSKGRAIRLTFTVDIDLDSDQFPVTANPFTPLHPSIFFVQNKQVDDENSVPLAVAFPRLLKLIVKVLYVFRRTETWILYEYTNNNLKNVCAFFIWYSCMQIQSASNLYKIVQFFSPLISYFWKKKEGNDLISWIECKIDKIDWQTLKSVHFRPLVLITVTRKMSKFLIILFSPLSHAHGIYI